MGSGSDVNFYQRSTELGTVEGSTTVNLIFNEGRGVWSGEHKSYCPPLVEPDSNDVVVQDFG